MILPHLRRAAEIQIGGPFDIPCIRTFGEYTYACLVFALHARIASDRTEGEL